MIVLIGFMGAGKSTVGRIISSKVGLPFFDTDALVTRRAGASIIDIFKTGGEPAFRELEREVVLETLDGQDAVVALGGGALGDPAVASLLQGKDIVHLEVQWGEVRKRLRGDTSRPLLRAADPKALFDSRQGLYQMVRRYSVETDGMAPEEVARAVMRITGAGIPAGDEPQRVVVPLGRNSYDVVVGRELVERFANFMPDRVHPEKAFLITHPHLERLAKEIISSLAESGVKANPVFVAEGERSKAIQEAQRLWGHLAAMEAHRSDLVISVGGGVICDLAGFVASTYARGLPLVHVPTTLLAQVDAAVGGKCGVNIPEGKNLIGSIYQPATVICDVDVLASLPEKEFRSGMAEVVKYGLIADPDLLTGLDIKYKRLFDGRSLDLIELVARCVSIKASFVADDERDEGRRAILNYGHTFAHAVERMSGYGGLRHGEAVAIGMMAAAYLSRELGRLNEEGIEMHRGTLASLGLPTTADLDLDQMERTWQHDKKYQGGVRFVLLNALGDPEAGIRAPRRAIETALGRLRT